MSLQQASSMATMKKWRRRDGRQMEGEESSRCVVARMLCVACVEPMAVFGDLRALYAKAQEVAFRGVVRGVHILKVRAFQSVIIEDDEKRIGLTLPIGKVFTSQDSNF